MRAPEHGLRRWATFALPLLAAAVVVVIVLLAGTGNHPPQRTGPVVPQHQHFPQPEPMPVGAGHGWHLIFDDEFDGPQVDRSVWNLNWFGNSPDLPSNGLGHNDLNCDSPDAVSQAGGELLLQVSRTPCRTDVGRTYPWTGTLINTHDKFQFAYGFLEARIHIPTSNGKLINSVSFWADGVGTWPYTGELDIVEVLPCHGRTRLAYHFHNPEGATGRCVNLRHPGGWHTFGADWRPGAVTYYYDGRRIGTLTRGITSAPMYVIVSYSVPEHAAPNIQPATARVEYVRVWQRGPAPSSQR